MATMVPLTLEQMQFLLNLISEKYGFGYSVKEVDGVKIGALQAALSCGVQVEAEKKPITQGSKV